MRERGWSFVFHICEVLNNREKTIKGIWATLELWSSYCSAGWGWYTMSHIQKFWQTITNLKKLWLPTKAIPLSVRAHGTTWSISHFLFKEKQSFVMSKWIIARIVSLLNSICGGQAFRNNCLFVHLVCLGAQTPGGKDPLRSCLQKIVFVFFFLSQV